MICEEDNGSNSCLFKNTLQIDEELNFQINTKSYRDSKKTIYFLNNNIKTMPGGVFTAYKNVDWIRLINCQITQIDEYTFKDAQKLKLLYLIENRISYLSNSTFNGVENLHNLALSFNEIEHLPIGIFDKLNKLEELNLNYNKIKHLDEIIFSGLEQLGRLYINNNQLKVINPNLFSQNNEIYHLELQNNQITYIEDSIQKLKKLRILKLTGNKLMKLNYYPESVEALLIRNNKLTKLFINKNVETLHADNNKIGEVSATIVNKIVKLRLAKNQIWNLEGINKLLSAGSLNFTSNPFNEIFNRFLKNNSFFIYLTLLNDKLMPTCRRLLSENVSRYFNFTGRGWITEYNGCVHEFLMIIGPILYY